MGGVFSVLRFLSLSYRDGSLLRPMLSKYICTDLKY